MAFPHVYLGIEIRASSAIFINLHFNLQFKKSCTNFVLAFTATQKVYISWMSSTAAIREGKLPTDAPRLWFKMSWGSRSSVFHHLPSKRSYFITQLPTVLHTTFSVIWLIGFHCKTLNGVSFEELSIPQPSLSPVSIEMLRMVTEHNVKLHIPGCNWRIWGNAIFDCGGKSNLLEVQYSSCIWRTLTSFPSFTFVVTAECQSKL